MKNPPFSQTILKELLSLSTLFWTIFLAVMYIFLIDLLLNFRLVDSLANFPLSSALSLLGSLFIGSFTSMSSQPFTLTILLLNAILTGLNLVLLLKSIKGLEGKGKIHLSIGGATLFSLVTAGCTSCGLSLISIVGLSATLTFLPFHGAELRVISLGLLLISAIFMLKELHKAKYCRV